MNVNKRVSAKEALEHPWFTLLKTKEYFIKVNEYFMNKTINNLIMYKPKNKLQQLALTYLVHNFPDLNEIRNINKIFLMFNTSDNGKLSREETYQGLLKYLNYSSEEELEQKVNKIFKNIDNDNNGFIECEEFSRAALDKRIFLDENVLKFTFDFMDKDGSGEISLSELKEVFGVKDDKESEKLLKEIIDKIDKDGNGEISIKEYSDMMKNIII
jgi:Ca2+-binding EF-hand superfamily protein